MTSLRGRLGSIAESGVPYAFSVKNSIHTPHTITCLILSLSVLSLLPISNLSLHPYPDLQHLSRPVSFVARPIESRSNPAYPYPYLVSFLGAASAAAPSARIRGAAGGSKAASISFIPYIELNYTAHPPEIILPTLPPVSYPPPTTTLHLVSFIGAPRNPSPESAPFPIFFGRARARISRRYFAWVPLGAPIHQPDTTPAATTTSTITLTPTTTSTATTQAHPSPTNTPTTTPTPFPDAPCGYELTGWINVWETRGTDLALALLVLYRTLPCTPGIYPDPNQSSNVLVGRCEPGVCQALAVVFEAWGYHVRWGGG